MQDIRVNVEKTEKQEQAKLPITWSDFEYKYAPKRPDWFWFLGSGALIFIIASILMKNFLMAVFTLVSAVSIIIFAVKKPKRISVSIEEKGIKIDEKLYGYSEIKSFWAEEEKKELHLELNGELIRYIKVPLGDSDPEIIKSALMKHLKEKPYAPIFSETIAEILGF